MQIKTKESILFIGDSITDCGRRTTDRPLGQGYVKFFTDLLILREPTMQISVMNKGIDGDVVAGLRNRWQDDVLYNRPDWLFIKIGINDLHRTLMKSPDAIPPDIFREVYEDIITKTKTALPKCKMVLIDPFYISRDNSKNSFCHEVLQLLPEYLKIVSKLSKKHKTYHLTTHEIFQRLLNDHEPDAFCPEPVHPNQTGHLAIAEFLYKLLR